LKIPRAVKRCRKWSDVLSDLKAPGHYLNLELILGRHLRDHPLAKIFHFLGADAPMMPDELPELP